MNRENLRIAIITPVRNEESYISNTLEAISRLSYENKNIVDSANMDKLSEVAKSLNAHVVKIGSTTTLMGRG